MTVERRKKERRHPNRPRFPVVGFDGTAAERLYQHTTRYDLEYPRTAEDVKAVIEWVIAKIKEEEAL